MSHAAGSTVADRRLAARLGCDAEIGPLAPHGGTANLRRRSWWPCRICCYGCLHGSCATQVGAVNEAIRCVDLFAGAGGFSLGFEHANSMIESFHYEHVLAVEHDAAAARTYKSNFDGTVLDTDIELVDAATYPDADLVLGGPPCQGFSPLGRNRHALSRSALNGLWSYYIDAITTVRPLAFVIEIAGLRERYMGTELCWPRDAPASHRALRPPRTDGK